MSERLLDKVAIVTGAARGIGYEIARTFAEEGAHLALFDTQYDVLEAVKREITERWSGKVTIHKVDVGNTIDVSQKVDEVVQLYGRVDILINNAGTNVFTDILSMTSEDWESCLSVNLMGAMNCCRSAIAYMLENSCGSIVNIASVHGHKIVKGALPYTISKHAIIGLSRSLAIEYAESGIRVNTISPGLIDTPLATRYFESFTDSKAERDKQRQFIPVKRFGRPEEVAKTALFLASDEARFINAANILIDGGRSQVYCD